MSLHLDLPVHPTTGLTAIGLRRNGTPIWPVIGGSGEGDQPAEPVAEAPTDKPADGPPTDKPDAKPADPKPTDTVEFWKAKARDWESKSKSNSEAAKRLAQIEEANKTAEQKAAEAHAAAEKRAAEAERALMRFRVAAKAGLDADLAERLRGESEDDLLADAELLKAKLTPTQPVKHVPKPDSSQGAKGEVKPSTASGRDLWAQRHPNKTR